MVSIAFCNSPFCSYIKDRLPYMINVPGVYFPFVDKLTFRAFCRLSIASGYFPKHMYASPTLLRNRPVSGCLSPAIFCKISRAC